MMHFSPWKGWTALAVGVFALLLPAQGADAKLEAQNPFDFKQFTADVAAGETTMRGVMVTMVDPDVEYIQQYLREIKDAGCNILRMNTYPTEGMNAEEIAAFSLPERWDDPNVKAQAWVKGSIGQVNRMLPFCAEIGLPVIITLDAGFYPLISDNKAPLWTDSQLQENAAELLIEKARYFSQCSAVIGYDLVNEPIPPGSQPWVEDGVWLTWGYDQELAKREVPGGDHVLADFYNKVIAGIRTFDQERLIVLEPGPWGYPAAFPGLLSVVDDPRVIFSFHFYDPHYFSHSDVAAWGAKNGSVAASAPYPKTEKSITFNRDLLAKATQSAADFQAARTAITGRPTIIWIGEFGSVRWNDKQSQMNWYTDALSVMNERNWGWAYFLYSPTHSDWHNFGPLGPEGEDIDKERYFKARQENDLEYFKAMNAQGPRPSFQLLMDEWKKNQQ